MTTRVQFRAAVCERPYTILTVLALIGLGAVVLLRRPEDWEPVYVPAGRLLVEGRDIYQLQITAFPYPPAAALLAAAFAQLPGKLGRVVWCLVNAAAIVAFWVCAWRSAGGVRHLRCVDLRDGGASTLRQTDWREHAALWLGMAVGFRFVTDVLEHQQTDLW